MFIMKRRLFIFILLLGSLFSLSAQKKDKSAETVKYQWVFREYYSDDLGSMFDVFLYESVNDEEHYVFSLPQYCSPWVNEGTGLKKKGAQTISSFSSWYAGGGVGGVLFYANGKLEVYKVFLEEDEGGSEFVEKEADLVIDIGKASKFISKKERTAGIIDFNRTLKIEKKHVYGDDVFYLQCMLYHFFNQKIDIDGYFGKQTEGAVKAAQKKIGLPQTGIVTEEVWNAFEDYAAEEGDLFNL